MWRSSVLPVSWKMLHKPRRTDPGGETEAVVEPLSTNTLQLCINIGELMQIE